MNNQLLLGMLYALGTLSVFLLIGVFLRAKIPLFQKTFLPASVIGGFLLLALGPQGANWLPIPTDWMSFYRLLPGVLIIPIVTAVPLGLHWSRKEEGASLLVPLFAIAMGISFLQFALGWAVGALWPSSSGLYPTFGWEMGLGFAGGHGTAGLLSQMLQAMNLDYWADAQGVGVTMATIGLVGGILVGIFLINIGARRGWLSSLKNPQALPTSLLVGYEKDVTRQESLGRSTTLPVSIDPLAFHSALILAACLIAYGILSWLKAAHVPVLSKVTIWAWGMVVMAIIYGAMSAFKLDFLVDAKVKGRLCGWLTEFAVIAAIGSMPLKTVLAWWAPITVLGVVGLVGTVLFLVWATRRFITNHWFEQCLTMVGMYTGVFVTGLLLLRIVDPNYQTPVLARYGIIYTLSGLLYFSLLGPMLHFVNDYGALYGALLNGVGVVLCVLVAQVAVMLFKPKSMS